MLDRTRQLEQLTHLLKSNPVVAILGARQVGKTMTRHERMPILIGQEI